jgi:hypothetical protein
MFIIIIRHFELIYFNIYHSSQNAPLKLKPRLHLMIFLHAALGTLISHVSPSKAGMTVGENGPMASALG